MLRAEPFPAAPLAASSPRRGARNRDGSTLLCSLSFRLGLTFWLLFVCILTITGLSFHRSLQTRLLGGIDASLEGQLGAIVAVHARLGPEAAITLAEGARAPGGRVRFHLAGASGERVAGNLPRGLSEPARRTVTGETLGLADTDRHRVLSGPLESGLLTLERGLEPLDELRASALWCLLRALALATLLGVVAALALAWRTQRRLLGWSGALERVASGDLGARLPLDGKHDDVDWMAGRINEMLDRLGRTVDGVRQVSTDIAHDLKTPLNRLIIELEEAVAQSRTGSDLGEPLERALREASEINGTFEALLSIARIEAGARKTRFRTFALAPLLDELAEIYAPVVEEAGLTLALALPPDDPLPLLGDRSLITQQVVNLIENALRHGAPSATTITLGAGRRDDRVWLGVADDGPGIPEAERENVFRRLYRLERSRTTRGTGLGLSLVKAIAELHCGAIRVEDRAPGLAIAITFDDRCPLER